jgi:hypothetical protein
VERIEPGELVRDAEGAAVPAIGRRLDAALPGGRHLAATVGVATSGGPAGAVVHRATIRDGTLGCRKRVRTRHAGLWPPGTATAIVSVNHRAIEGAGLAVTIRVVGQASKRGMIPRLPVPDGLLADAGAWIAAEYPQILRGSRSGPVSALPELSLDLHPAAGPLTITADADGRLTAAADASSAGPGYHTFVARVLERLGEQLGVTWTREHEPGAEDASPTNGWGRPLVERAAVEREHIALLARVLGRAAELRTAGVSGIQVGTRPGTQFEFEGAIGTPLGPRDDGWLARAAGDPRLGADIRPWWLDATDARYLLQRALVILWTDVRWRPPATDEERAGMDEALALLRRALPSDASLPYPWREWVELIALRGVPDPIADRVAREAERADRRRPPIGYRRRPVTVVHEGWALQVPGTFGERRSSDDWMGGERGRQVTIAATETRASDGAPMSAGWFLSKVAGDLGDDVLHHHDGEVAGKARLTTDATSGLEVAVLEGFSATTGRGAAIRVEFEDPSDWRWAVDLWRSLRPA